MNQVCVFDYSSAKRFLLDAVADKQKNEKASLRVLAKDMGFGSHTLLLMILQGKRNLRVKHASFIAKGLSLSTQERLYLQALIQFENASDPDEKQLCQTWLSDLHPQDKKFSSREIDEYQFYAKWLHTAILASTYLKGGIASAADVVRLFGNVTRAEAEAALERLQQLGLIEIDKKGRFKSCYSEIRSKNDVLNMAIQSYHKSMCEKASEAVTKFDVAEREFQSLSIPIRADQIPLAKDLIRKFRASFMKAMATEVGDEVYQLNVQFFQLTESRRATARKDEGVDTEIRIKKEKLNA